MITQKQCPNCGYYRVQKDKVVYKEKKEKNDGCGHIFLFIFLTIITGGLYWLISWALLNQGGDIEVEADKPFDPYYRYHCYHCGYEWSEYE